MIEVEEDIYEYEFETIIDVPTKLKIVVNDTDKDIELELPEVEVVEGHTHKYVDGKCSCGKKDPNYKEPSKDPNEGGNQGGNQGGTGGASMCPQAAAFVTGLTIIAAAAILLIRKKR